MISVYVVDNWMMIVSSLLILNECAADWNDRFPTLVLSSAWREQHPVSLLFDRFSFWFELCLKRATFSKLIV